MGFVIPALTIQFIVKHAMRLLFEEKTVNACQTVLSDTQLIKLIKVATADRTSKRERNQKSID